MRILEQAGGIEIDEVTGTQRYTIPMHANQPPYDDLGVRLALKYAIDRESLLKTARTSPRPTTHSRSDSSGGEKLELGVRPFCRLHRLPLQNIDR